MIANHSTLAKVVRTPTGPPGVKSLAQVLPQHSHPDRNLNPSLAHVVLPSYQQAAEISSRVCPCSVSDSTMVLLRLCVLAVVLYAQLDSSASAPTEDRTMWSMENWQEEPVEKALALHLSDLLKRSKPPQFHGLMGRSSGKVLSSTAAHLHIPLCFTLNTLHH
ncbi:hypothetical protein NFI96_026607 [Prochilodus magdalenae]|nr:hypothetical protein NFI96_026607 [Prochilodus magdalenae]